MHVALSDAPLNQLEFKLADHYSLPLVKSFYKKNGMRAQAPKGDLIYIATLNNSIVAALRLNPVNSTYLLRSMCVHADMRHQGIGSALLCYLQHTLSELQCYTFPYSHLEDFYSRANFVTCEAQSAPHAIADKFNRYVNNGKKLCLMKHQPQGNI